MTFLQEIPRQGKRWAPLLVAGALAGMIAAIPTTSCPLLRKNQPDATRS